MASQCETTSVWVSALTMTVDVRVIDCGKRSEGKKSRKELISRSVHSICTVSIFQTSVVSLRAKSMMTDLSNSRFNRHVIASDNGLLNFSSFLTLPFSGWDV